MIQTIRPKNGPLRAASMQAERKPVEASFPSRTRKKGAYEGTRARAGHSPRVIGESGGNRGNRGNRGNPGDSVGDLGELLATFARMKIIRSHRSGWRVEFSFGITSHKNYYVNSRVKNEETSASETN